MNAPLPTFDMMTGQQIMPGQVVPVETASMVVNYSDVVHVQLLDRMVVVPSAIVNGPTLRHFVTCPTGQAPVDQQGQAYLLFVTWKNFKPLLEYLSGNKVDLPSDKAELLELKQTARKFNAKEFERLVTRHMRQLYGGGCMGMSCFGSSNKHPMTYASPPKAQRQAAPAPVQPALATAPTQTQPAFATAPGHIQPALATVQPTSVPTRMQQQSRVQPAFTGMKLAPIKTKPAAKKSLFSRVRPSRHTRAEKAYDTKENGLYVAANAQEQPQVVYDLQRPLIV